jgi:hypothetical protein
MANLKNLEFVKDHIEEPEVRIIETDSQVFYTGVVSIYNSHG